jgi:hypothetical protein
MISELQSINGCTEMKDRREVEKGKEQGRRAGRVVIGTHGPFCLV